MRRRAGRPGVMGTMARTAVVAGTASATAGAVQRRGAQKAAAQQQAAAPPATPAAPPAAPAPAAPTPDEDDVVAKLQQLGDLKAQGVLDDAEFAAAKAKLLA
jgi:hypothetical protein